MSVTGFDPAAYTPYPSGTNRSRHDVESRIPGVLGGDPVGRWLRLAEELAAHSPDSAALAQAFAQEARRGVPSMLPAARLLLRLRRRPFTIDDRPFWDPLYRTYMVPPSLCLKTSRQVAKSTSLATSQVIQCVMLPDHQILHMMPLAEMTRRYSTNYVRPLIVESPFRDLIAPKGGAESVLQKDFHQGSRILFSYALTDASRVRGFNASQVDYDEVQNASMDIVNECDQTMQASPWKLRRRTGTPKGLSNTLTGIWDSSSQAEWCIWCPHGGCGHVNVPSLRHDLLAMIGPLRADICRERPGLVCAKCRKPVSPRTGRWVHAVKARRFDHPGYHISQPLVPEICENPEEWAKLLNAQKGLGGVSEAQFLNEVLGEVADTDRRLVSMQDLRGAMTLDWVNQVDVAAAQAGRYALKVLAVDWGGGGGTGPDGRGQTSFTALAVVGLGFDGKADVLWGYRSRFTHDPRLEARLVAHTFARFGCARIAHDMSNAGLHQEIAMHSMGVPPEAMVPIRYTASGSRRLFYYHPPSAEHGRPWWGLSKTESLAYLCQAVRYGIVRLPKDDLDADQCVYRDFLALTDERMSGKVGGDIYYIDRDVSRSDDFVHAVNMAAQTMWELNGQGRPSLAVAARFLYTPDQLDLISGGIGSDFDWSLVA